MSFPASATEPRLDPRICDLVAAGSVEISPRELHRAKDVGTLLPAGSCVYIPSLPGLPLARTLEAIAAIRDAGLDPVPHVSARRILNRDEFRDFLSQASAEYGVHRVLLLGGEDAPGVREGGVLSQPLREVTVEALPLEVPEHLDLDVSRMDIGGTLRISDLTAPEGVTLLDDQELVVATVTAPTKVVEPEPTEEELAALEAEAELAEGEEGAEGEAAEGAAGESEAESSGDKSTDEG